MLSRTWQYLSALGTHDDQAPARAKRVILSNRLVFVCMIPSVLYAPVLWLLGAPSTAFLLMLAASSYSLTWVFNRRRWYTAARVALWLNTNFYIFVFSSTLQGSRIEDFLFVTGAMCLVLFENRRLMVLLFTATMVLALGLDRSIGAWLPHVVIGDHLAVFRATIIAWAMLCNLLLFWVIYDENRNSEEALRRSLVQLRTEIEQREVIAAELRDATQAARSASAAKSRFLANMSHEIRTPLSGVIGLTELALDTHLDHTQRAYLVQAKESAEHLLQLLNGVLDLSKVEAGRLTLEATPINMAVLIDQVIGAVAPIAEERGLLLHVSTDTGGQPSRLGDPLRLRQVLLNLLNNALKFTERGQVSLTVEPVDGDTLRFEVRDTGIGMSKAQLENVFKAFTQAETSTSRHYGGTGLGLTISRELVELFGGRLEADSEPGLGTVFSFTAVLPPHSAAAEDTAEEPPEIKPMRILLAEDNRINQLVARKLLEKLGHTVTVVDNGHAAVEQARTAAYDVILMDMHMPELDGLEATRQIRRLEGHTGRVPVFALTADAMESARARCLEAGMNGHMSKPLRVNEVSKTLASVMLQAAAVT